ncbi:MAG: acyltransferase family protein [Mycolicibacterium sp.]|uniref:acyltransferase family protein n=1 Tax=Mycolicibacterium sp. TaxID=2320850 RepID=UPI003D0F31D9
MTAVGAAPIRVGPRTYVSPRRGIAALDGVRAIAVILVLADHGGIPGLSGGFLGVDVFFVLSGFLITSLLIDEIDRTGRIGLRDFWIRRARRLLPALIVMVLAVVAARELFSAESVGALRDHAVATFFWMSNWVFVAEKSDYFSQGASPSPLQHTWSLAVEEQYYVLWPLLLAGVVAGLAALAYRRGVPLTGRMVRIAVFLVAAAGVAASAGATMLFSSGASQTTLNRIYFGTDTRVQALLVGAAAAALLVRDWRGLTSGAVLLRSRWARWLACALPVAGLAVLGAAAHFAVGSAQEFGGGLLILVAGAAILVIASVTLEQDGPVARLLALPPLVGLGAISYGVYLWHWPIFLVLNGERTGLAGWELFALRSATTIAVATVTWWLVEQPVRRWRPMTVPMLPLAAATAATAAVVTMTVLPVGVRGSGGPKIDTAALIAPEIPVEVSTPARQRAPGDVTVAVFGDSIAWTLMRYLPPTPNLDFADYTTIGCGIARGGPYEYVGQELDQKPECDAWPSRWEQRISHEQPDVVLLVVGRWEVVDRMHDGRWTHIGEPRYDAYLRRELNRALDILGSTGARIVVTTEPYNRRAERADGSLYPEDQPGRVDRWNLMLRSVVAERDNASVLDLNRKLNPNGAYTTRVDGIRMRSDGVHPTPEAVEWLTPWLVEALNPQQ